MTSSTEVVMLSAGSVHEYSTDSDKIKHTPRSRHNRKTPQSPQEISEEARLEIEELVEDVPQIGQLFVVIDKIGSGTFSSVYAARIKEYPQIKELFALKHIIPTSHPSRIENELRCLKDIGGGDNVMGVKACIREKDHVVIVMPYFSHNRFQDYVQDLSFGEIREYMRNLLISLRRVHKEDIIHRDVKPSNFLYNRKTKQYALVDFGLAMKAPKLLQAKTKTPEGTRSSKRTPLSPRKGNNQQNSDTITITQRKRSLDLEGTENQPTSPSKKKRLSSGAAENNQENEKNITNKQPLINPSTHNTKISPRRMLLTRRAIQNKDKPVFQKPEQLKKTVIVEKNGKAVYKQVAPSSCGCYGQPMICSVCMSRSAQHAPRAGTPGFRSPEVLMKCPDQTTAVDMWSAGVIFLSLLSGRYPFFKANDDMTALAQIVSIVGSDTMKKAAKSSGKSLLFNPTMPSLDLKLMCSRLRQLPKSKTKSSDNKSENKNNVNLIEEIPDSAFDLLKRLLDCNPHSRISADGALKHNFFTVDIS